MPIDPNRVQAVFLLAVEAADVAARAEILERECSADAELRQRVEALLAAHDASGGFLDRPQVSPFSTVDEPRRIEGPGGRIGPYKLLQQIGEGGMGVVYLAEQLEPVQRKVALKVIKPGMDTHQVVARFEAERQALALMDHPNIAKVLDAGATDSGRPYFVMELVKGLPITKYCDQEHLTPQERLNLFVPICQAVQHAHQKGIIHRDLKPSNILIALYDSKPVPKVIDFGVAKATGTKLTERTLFTEVGHAIGTWEYMAPEQAEVNNLDIDTRADVYALGATLYELLTGSPPFTRQQLRKAAFADMLHMIREVEPSKPSTRLSSSDELPSLAAKRKLEPAKLSRLVRGDLDWIVMKCLEKERARRYETANQLGEELQRFLGDEPVQAGPPSAGYRAKKFLKRNKGTAIAAGLVTLALVAGIIGTSIGLVMAERARENEATQRERAEHEKKLAENATKLAQQETQRAEDEKKRAEDEKKLAENATKLAQQETQRAEDEKKRAEDEKKLAVIATQLAQKETLRAEGERKRAENEKNLADIAKKKAQDNETTAEWRLYVSQIAFAQREWETYDPRHANRYLAACRQDLRGWEHDYLYTLFNMNQQTLRGHTETVYSIAFSPDGKKIVSGSWDKTLKVWDASSGLETLTLKGHSAPVHSVAFSPDGKKIVSASWDKTLKVWDASSGLETLTLKGHSAPVHSVAFSPDGKKIVSGSDDKTLKVWDASSGLETLTLKGHSGRVNSVAFSPDGKKIASASDDDTLKVWDEPSGQETLNLIGHTSSVTCVAFSPDGKKIVSGSFDKTVKAWDVTNGHETLTLEGHEDRVQCVAFSPDGKKIITGSYGTLRVWDASSGQKTLTRRGHIATVTSVAFSPDGKKIASGSFDDTLKLWDELGGQETLTLKGHTGAVTNVAFSPNGKNIVSASVDKTLKVWDATSGQETLTLKGHTSIVTCVAFSPDSKKIVSGSFDKTVKVWDVTSGREILNLKGHRDRVNSVAFNPDGKTIVSGSDDKTLKVWDERSGQEILTLWGHKGAVHSVAFSPDGKKIASGSWDYTLKVWDASSGQKTLTFRARANSVAFSPDGKKIVTGQAGGTAVYVWNAKNGQRILTLLPETGTVQAVAFSPDGKNIVIGGVGNTLKLFDVSSGQETLTLKGHTGFVNTVAFSPDGKKIVSGSDDKTLKVWDGSLSMDLRNGVHEVGQGLILRGRLDKQTPTIIYQPILAAGKTYVIDMVSSNQAALDPYLVLTDASGKKLAEDDDGGGGLNARIAFRADKTGTYRIQATSFNAGAGSFTLTVREQANPPKEEKR